MGFRLAPCLVLWDFKTDGWPPVPISNPSPQPRPPWIELRRALAWFRLAPSLVLWDFGWHLVWFYGISKLTDGPLSRSQTPPHSRDRAAAGFSMVSAGNFSGFMGFRLAPCLVLWDFKTDGWPPVPISNPSPQPRPPWIELRRAVAWFRLAPFYGISAGTLSGFMGFQN